MTRNISARARHYQRGLQTFLGEGGQANLASAVGLGTGFQMHELAVLHEQTLLRKVLPGRPARQRTALIKKAGKFFAMAITPAVKGPDSLEQTSAHLTTFIAILGQRTVELAASNMELSLEITQRKAVEAALKKSERHYTSLLEKSDRLQEQSRRLSRQILSAQEEERKEISRELHDVIAQALTGINVRLATLKREAATNTKGLDRNIALTQRLVEKSVGIVHQFARELRPAVLDDLGLIPALHSFMKDFTERTGVRTRLTAFAGVELLDIGRRTVLFRVAQEALTNVARHAKASKVDVDIRQLPKTICMKIKDDGKSFSVERAWHARRGKRLGLLGMRERLEMVGGSFAVNSSPGKGTTIRAEIPPGKTRSPRGEQTVEGGISPALPKAP